MTAETTRPSETLPADDARGLGSRSFLGLLVTQFLGATNDNIFRWLVVPIGKCLVQEQYGPGHEAAALSAGLACFVLPYILLAAPAGYVADRFSKRTVIVGCKVAEVLIMILGAATILLGNLYLMFAVVALMGAQSAMFAPSKFGSIPEIVREDRISAANGWIGMTTVLAIMAGSFAGGLLFVCTTPKTPEGVLLTEPGHHMWWISAAVLIGVAAAGLATSLLIRPLKAADPSRAFPYNAPKQTVSDLVALTSNRPLLRAALGTVMFWGLGSMAQMNVDLFVVRDLDVGQIHVGVLLAILVIGVGIGSVLAGAMSGGRVELGIVSLGAGGIAVSAMLLFTVPQANGSWQSPAYFWSCLWLFMLGTSAGMYDIPIQAFLQHRSPNKSRGSILAASNFLTFSGMLATAGIFWLVNDVAELSPRAIFLLLGIATVPVFLYVVWLLPGPTTRVLVWLLTHSIYRVRVQGRANLPTEGGALLVSNHVSWIDGVLLILHCPRPIRMVGYADYIEKWWLRWLAKDMGAIPIKPGKKSVVQTIRAVREALREGDLVCLFPEGNITRSGKMEPFQPGFLSMVKKTDAPVVPVYLGGLWGSIFSFEGGRFFWKRPKRWPYPVSISIGRPISEPTDAGEVHEAVRSLGEK